jgi:hypothetical protein
VAIELFILDACVLIDFVTTDPMLLKLTSEHVGPVHVASVVLSEVDQLDESSAASLGVHVVEPSLELSLDAAARGGALSFEDWVSLLLARDNDWTCVTNDRRLRTECESHHVKVRWSLALLELLVRAGALTAAAAIDTAAAFQRANPRYITDTIVKRFRARLR